MGHGITLDGTDGFAVTIMGRTFMAELSAAIGRVEGATAIDGAVATSGLPGVFSGGADMKELEGLDAQGRGRWPAEGLRGEARCDVRAHLLGGTSEGIHARLQKRPARARGR